MQNSTLTPYFTNKFFSLLLTFIVFFLVSLSPSLQEQWRWLILLFIVFGQGHYLTSYVYQFSSFKRKLPNFTGRILFFVTLFVTLDLLFFLRYGLDFRFVILIFIGAFFIMHHTLNERTMLLFYTSKKEDKRSYLLAFILMLLLIWTLFTSLNADSFSYLLSDNVITFSTIEKEIPLNTDRVLIPEYFIAAPFFLALLLGIIYIKKAFSSQKISVLYLILTFALFIGINVLHLIKDFIYFLSFFIIFHYITWFLFFLTRTTDEGPLLMRRTPYVLLNGGINVIILGLVVLGNLFPQTILFDLYVVFFSLEYFAFWTFLHIASTLINEKPIQKLFSLLR